MIKQSVSLLVSGLIALSLCSCTSDITLSNESGEPSGTEYITSNESTIAVSSVDSTDTTQSTEASTTSTKAGVTTSTKKQTSTTSQKHTIKATVNPLDVPLVFDDALVEKLVRDFVDKPNGSVYPRDFSDFITTTKNFVVQYNEDANTICFMDWIGVGNMAEVNGKVRSFKALSTIPFAYIHLESVSDIRYFCSEALQSIRIFNSSISNLDSLNKCKNLEFFYVDNCEGVDFSLLPDLQNVKGISITDCTISGLSILKKYSKLTNLELRKNVKFNLSDLRGLPALEKLSFKCQPGMDFTVLTSLPKLKTLDISNGSLLPSSISAELANMGVKINTYA